MPTSIKKRRREADPLRSGGYRHDDGSHEQEAEAVSTPQCFHSVDPRDVGRWTRQGNHRSHFGTDGAATCGDRMSHTMHVAVPVPSS